ncbi:MAG: tripartite tricarboxylate transporter permease [Candidatus ainarchaeum sp.]|nr:tripartite tricarboxylate transporter permease [Candidatus ainarchaeum sp.]
MLEMALFFFVGLAAGIASGLFPGLHPNLISSIALVQNIEYEKKAVLIVSVYAGHIIFSAVPAVFFGIPDESTIVSVLPGNRMALDGNGIAAIKTMAVSTLFASVLALLFMPFALWFYPQAYGAASPYLIYILVLASLLLVARTKKPLLSAAVFLAAGLLGFYALRMEMQDGFLPLFSGFFAMGAILNYRKQKMPRQKDGNLDLGILKYSALGMALGGLANLIPAISSPAQIAAFASIFIAFETENYLATVAAVNAGQFVFALASSASMDKARHGLVINLAQIIGIGENLNMLLFYFLLGIAIAGAALFLLRKKAGQLSGVDFSWFNWILALYLLFVVFTLDGVLGVLVFAISSALGYATVRIGVERTVMMAAIIVPTILLLVGIS